MVGEHTVEIELLSGLRPFVEAELAPAPVLEGDDDSLSVRWRGDLRRLLELRTAVAAYLLRSHPVPRPKALLGHQHLTALLADVDTVRALHPAEAFSSFRFGAAGSDSAVFTRLAAELEEATGLDHRRDEGDLLIRVRPGGGGWETLVRMSPRPLSARRWRVRDLPGALNATIAAAMVALTEPRRGDRVLNLMCGSGTLLVERALWPGPAPARLVGLDTEPVVEENLAAAGVAAEVATGDATETGLPTGAFDVVLADLPYGHRMGSHADNESLYASTLAEAARVCSPGARFAVLTHELRIFERVLADQTAWTESQSLQVFQKGHHPKLTLLRRN